MTRSYSWNRTDKHLNSSCNGTNLKLTARCSDLDSWSGHRELETSQEIEFIKVRCWFFFLTTLSRVPRYLNTHNNRNSFCIYVCRKYSDLRREYFLNIFISADVISMFLWLIVLRSDSQHLLSVCLTRTDVCFIFLLNLQSSSTM